MIRVIDVIDGETYKLITNVDGYPPGTPVVATVAAGDWDEIAFSINGVLLNIDEDYDDVNDCAVFKEVVPL